MLNTEQAGRYEITSHAELNFLQVKRIEDNLMAMATAQRKKEVSLHCSLLFLVEEQNVFNNKNIFNEMELTMFWPFWSDH
jgi:hypothetical protein